LREKSGPFCVPLGRIKNEYGKSFSVALDIPVSCFDLKQVKHTVEVSADSDYQAVAQALRIFHTPAIEGKCVG
jgi:hypothetical protein